MQLTFLDMVGVCPLTLNALFVTKIEEIAVSS